MRVLGPRRYARRIPMCFQADEDLKEKAGFARKSPRKRLVGADQIDARQRLVRRIGVQRTH